MQSLNNILQKLRGLLRRYPNEVGVRPDSFAGLPGAAVSGRRIAFQLVADKFYFLLFGAILKSLGAGADLLVIRSVNGAIGVGPIAEAKRSAPLAWLTSKPWIRAYRDFHPKIVYRAATWAHPVSDVRDWYLAGEMWRRLKRDFHEDGGSLLVDGIEVLDLLISSYLRFRPSPVFDVNDRLVRRLIWQAMRNARMARKYFKHSQPAAYLTSYTTYVEHGVPVRVALSEGVRVCSFGNLSQFGKILSIQDPYHTANFLNYKRNFDALADQEQKLELAAQQLDFRLSGGVDNATSYMRESAYAQNALQLPADLAGAVVIFLHDFYDSPHVYPDLIFHDFWRWVCFTIDELQKMGATFYLKPHPNQIDLSESALGELQKKYPGLKWLPAKASNAKLAKQGIACGITVYGTVAHELAYLGIPTIACARHPHIAFGFCRTAHTRQEYAELLRSYAAFALPVSEMRRQALAFYYMHNLNAEAMELQVLRDAFVAFWRACNVPQPSGEAMGDALLELVRLPGFNHFTQFIAKEEVKQNR